MSEFIRDREQERRIRGLIERLHQGEPAQEVKAELATLLEGLQAHELAAAEQSLINEGMKPEEIQRLCEVHVSLFEDELAKNEQEDQVPGHPLDTYRRENRELEKLLGTMKPKTELTPASYVRLREIEAHYQRKENQLFPRLERRGFTGPTTVMWGKHDEIRELMKDLGTHVGKRPPKGLLKRLVSLMKKMIFMEERILFPAAIKQLSQEDWAAIKAEEPQIGFSWITPSGVWDSGAAAMSSRRVTEQTSGEIGLNEGALTPWQLDRMLTSLPFDLTFVDKHDRVRYYTNSDDRVFPRSPSIIGREVQKCHPPKSVDVVMRILEAFREKRKDHASFHLDVSGRKIQISYYPIYDEQGEYAGVIECSQDITEILKITGEKRLLDW